ncbi:MAG: hypothetical protein U9Q61_10580 [Thermodesulfobacteriota bacterium]|nr:hypothetical protein [Thermodesulfobacteriota bacterium]
MSIFPDWIELDIGTGTAKVVDMLEVELADPVIEIEMEAAIIVDIVNDSIEVEVI